ncbi:MAG: type II 3-dehydroquinate dehydratase [Nocardioides sp.]|uniref:type II 3-dehydroquinate dehydratase n=1 Tax=Nocardioides sp. TaxID=35761 RepID=UPI0039E42F4F
MHAIAVIQGPNLNRLGRRRPERYGHETLADVTSRLDEFAGALDMTLCHIQSNHEGVLVDWVHEHTDVDAVIVNPAGLTPYGRPLYDAVFDLEVPVAVVHITQLYRHYGASTPDLFKADADVYLCGLGVFGYSAALVRLHQLLTGTTRTPPPTALR